MAALINMGISPGITNFLIGDQICRISSEHRKELEIESIDLYLLEDIDADAIIFSWAPAVALDELSQSPLQLRDGRMIVHEPFTAARDYQFPHEPRMWRQYPLYKEELLSLHRSYPQVEHIGIYTGGSEVELVKALQQPNLLSKETLGANPELTIEAVVRALYRSLRKHPRRDERVVRATEKRGGGGLSSPTASHTSSTLRQPLLAAALVDAALAGALCTLAGAVLTAAAALALRAAGIRACIDLGHDGHEAQRRPEQETVHGTILFG